MRVIIQSAVNESVVGFNARQLKWGYLMCTWVNGFNYF